MATEVNNPVSDVIGCRLPPDVAALCSLSTPYEVVSLNQHSCVIRTIGLELRFKWSTDNGWEWDEIVGEAHVHVEQMSNKFYWLGFDTAEGRVCVDIGSRSRKADVMMTGWSEGN